MEELPARCPKPRGNSVIISCFVDADHAGNRVTRRSHTGILIFVNNAPILFYSKRQNTVETSTFGSELVAMRIAKEMIVGLRHKLRMFGVPIDGPANVYCDNQGVVKNTSLPESTLSKKHNAINYHAVREACAAGIISSLPGLDGLGRKKTPRVFLLLSSRVKQEQCFNFSLFSFYLYVFR